MSGDFRKSLEIAKICQNNIPAKNKPQKTNTTPPSPKKPPQKTHQQKAKYPFKTWRFYDFT